MSEQLEKCEGGLPKEERSRAVRRGVLSRRTRGEHDDLLAAIHLLEAALASPAPGREEAWTRRVGHDLGRVSERLRSHVDSAESADGLYCELTAARPELQYRIEHLRMEHARLIGMAAALVKAAHPSSAGSFAEVREQAAELLGAVRGHHAKEVDLIYECFFTDIGVGD